MKQPPLPQVLEALDVAGGPALILDNQLRIIAASPGAERLLGDTVPPGTSAPSLLCGDRQKKPVAEALAAGRAIQATIEAPRRQRGGSDDKRLLEVRSIPLGTAAGGKPTGWLLLLRDAGAANDGVVEFHGMQSRERVMKQLFHMIERVAVDDVTVLIRGESGTGKELVAQALHALSPRRRGPFQAVNCAALSPTLLEAELFGALRGAFTGSHKDTPGLIRSAHKGTLFLDEVAELPLELQAKLLRVLETRLVLPVGGHEPVAVDVRILSATHRALRKEVVAGRFRADLMYRLRVIPLFLPPLRERRADLPLVAAKLVAELNERNPRRRVETLAPATLAALTQWSWPGNVRELKNALHYAFAMGDGPVLTPAELPPEILDQAPDDDGDEFDDDDADVVPAERTTLQTALRAAGGNRAEAALALGISRVTLWRRMKEAGLTVRARRQ